MARRRVRLFLIAFKSSTKKMKFLVKICFIWIAIYPLALGYLSLPHLSQSSLKSRKISHLPPLIRKEASLIKRDKLPITCSAAVVPSPQQQKELNIFQVFGYFFKWCWDRFLELFSPKKKTHTIQEKPFLIFINRNSGGKQGKLILKTLQEVLNSTNYCDLSKESVKEKLLAMYQTYNTSTLALSCGGDGTIRWIMDVAKELQISQNITFGIIPLGTGNDLFNHFIDSQYSTSVLENMAIKHLLTPTTLLSNPMLTFLLFRSPYKTIPFDRWQVQILSNRTTLLTAPDLSPEENPDKSTDITNEISTTNDLSLSSLHEDEVSVEGGGGSGSSGSVGIAAGVGSGLNERRKQLLHLINKKKDQFLHQPDLLFSSLPFLSRRKIVSKSFNNYFGIGVDGDITHAFDYFRKQSPYLFINPVINKMWYVFIWIYKFLKRSQKNLSDGSLVLYCDQQMIDLSKYPRLTGIILTNIGSYAGGSKLWQFGQSEEEAEKERRIHDADKAADAIQSWIDDKENAVSHFDNTEVVLNGWKNQYSDDGIIEV